MKRLELKLFRLRWSENRFGSENKSWSELYRADKQVLRTVPKQVLLKLNPSPGGVRDKWELTQEDNQTKTDF